MKWFKKAVELNSEDKKCAQEVSLSNCSEILEKSHQKSEEKKKALMLSLIYDPETKGYEIEEIIDKSGD